MTRSLVTNSLGPFLQIRLSWCRVWLFEWCVLAVGCLLVYVSMCLCVGSDSIEVNSTSTRNDWLLLVKTLPDRLDPCSQVSCLSNTFYPSLKFFYILFNTGLAKLLIQAEHVASDTISASQT